MDLESNVLKTRPHSLNSIIKKSLSTIGLNIGNQNVNVHEAKSFTGVIDELKVCNDEIKDHGGSINCHEQIYTDYSPTKYCDSKNNEKGYETREVTSNQIFFVRDDMLTYRGERYSVSDIAIKWKKDCRKWLWKGHKNIKNRSLGDLREKMQNIKIHN